MFFSMCRIDSRLCLFGWFFNWVLRLVSSVVNCCCIGIVGIIVLGIFVVVLVVFFMLVDILVLFGNFFCEGD